MSEVAEANPIQDLIQNTIDQNYTTANGNFMDIMTLKLNDVLDQEKIRLADQIYNGIEDVEGDGNEEEQLELDLVGDDEEIPDEPSEDQDFEEDGYEIDDEADDEFEETEEEDEE